MTAMAQGAITGFVLAGGKSSRMGADKAGLSLEGRTLLEHALAAIRPVCEEVFIVGSRQIYGNAGPGYEDIYSGCGPLGGIHAALTHAQTDLNLIIAVDTPFLTMALLNHLAEKARQASAMIVTLRVGGYIEPLCSVYARSFLPVAEAALKAGNYKLAPLFPAHRTVVIEEAELSKFAFAAEMFENLNTPEDLERARRRASGGKP
ncbi:MAG TPA: molybdenum cofactor guanylyltransferase [Verrucomicrobiae bacterium]|jgi:molybdopterin-guanine dinucleotide biosynthesis protein A|nr:molybdenum cofactor guanylyltransferase [Verrucomicrobiae bacterium]